jgi:hypothetical protein
MSSTRTRPPMSRGAVLPALPWRALTDEARRDWARLTAGDVVEGALVVGEIPAPIPLGAVVEVGLVLVVVVDAPTAPSAGLDGLGPPVPVGPTTGLDGVELEPGLVVVGPGGDTAGGGVEGTAPQMLV